MKSLLAHQTKSLIKKITWRGLSAATLFCLVIPGMPPTSLGRANPGMLQQQVSPGGYLHTSGSEILDASGAVVGLSGVNWFGFETANYAPHGLWSRNWQDLLDQIAQLGYNTIRLPFSNAMLAYQGMPSGIDYQLNPDLVDLTPLEVMDRIIAGAGARGLRILLDNHRSTPGGGPESNGLWYTDEFPQSRWIADWEMLAARYKGNPTVAGMDLRNEPHSACWGCGEAARDWRLAAEKAGNAILAVNPQLLIIVEGVGIHDGQSTWWGGNLLGAREAPVRLDVPHQLVYSPHDYPASIYPQSWFNDPAYPENLPEVWDRFWGYLVDEQAAPVLIGEFGTRYTTSTDRQWLETLRDYIKQKGLSWTFWSLNPNSGDTGGLLLDDWTSVHAEKQELLASIQYPSAGSAPVSPAPAKRPRPVMLDVLAAHSPAGWSVFQNPESEIGFTLVSWQPAEIHGMRLNYSLSPSGWAGVEQKFAFPQDWSHYEGITFRFFGRNSGNWIRVEILSNPAKPAYTDTYERFESRFRDDFNGWKSLSLEWADFKRRQDWQPAGASNDNLDLADIWGLSFAPVSGSGWFVLHQSGPPGLFVASSERNPQPNAGPASQPGSARSGSGWQ